MATETATIGANEAQTRFSELLERVEKGEEITITRHGSPVARMVPIQQVVSAESRREAIDAMRRLADRNRLGGLRIRDLAAELRK